MDAYDLCVLGAGPGGLSAAIRGAQRGAKVCLVDPGPLGGTCLNRGCIPARALGTTARLVGQLRKADQLGVKVQEVRVDLGLVRARKDRILRRLRAGLSTLLERSKVTWIQGRGILQGREEVEVASSGASSQGLRAKAIILATGSRPGTIPNCPIDGKVVITSDEILELERLPASFLVVGAGVVGCEFASYFADLGIPVTLVEAASQVLPSEDKSIAEAFSQSLRRRGATVLTGSKVQGIVTNPSGEAAVTLTSGQVLSAALVLVSTGRTPVLPEGTQALGLKLERGALLTDETLRTSVRSIFGIGDLLGEYQLACTASYEGALAAENAIGGARRVDYSVVPDAIYTEPEIASVGLTEAEATAKGIEVQISRLSFAGFARAQTLEETEGFVQLVADRANGRLLGVQMIGARATDLIGEAALSIKQGLTLTNLVDTIHGHPTMSESLWEASAMALGQSIYYASRD
ncbi:MAG: dihydrolipoyl dehydrogenase [Candidatus Omnitrophica bacterium]|nr:dihydrolipoyl dehydrogenase [Candidatus Omnitrophota bacterium]